MTDLTNFDSHLNDILNWHFSEKTGSPYWLEIKKTLDFDPLHDIQSFSDLAKFPDVANHLREVPVESLIPRGLHKAQLAGVFESGGTTGRPKRIMVFQQWLDELVTWRLQDQVRLENGEPSNTLALIPTGPHIVGAINRHRATEKGGLCFTVDLDPRWVKKCIQRKDINGMQEYANHIIDQAEDILYTQSVQCLIATPPILERMAQRPSLVAHMNKTLNEIVWGGTQMDPDTQAFLQTEVFPGISISASYGSTMILGEAKARHATNGNASVIFDSFAPNIILEVVDPQTLSPVEFNERGRVIMYHLSRYAFFPNVLERDTALRVPRNDGFPGASVSEVSPVSTIGGQAVIEGVY